MRSRRDIALAILAVLRDYPGGIPAFKDQSAHQVIKAPPSPAVWFIVAAAAGSESFAAGERLLFERMVTNGLKLPLDRVKVVAAASGELEGLKEVAPKAVVVLGGEAWQRTAPILEADGRAELGNRERARGTVGTVAGAPVVVSWSLAEVGESADRKRELWQDLQPVVAAVAAGEQN